MKQKATSAASEGAAAAALRAEKDAADIVGEDGTAMADLFTLQNVKAVIPAELMKADNVKGVKGVVSATCFFAGSMLLLGSDVFPWWCLPALWVLAGLSMTGLFAVAHSCGHYSYFSAKWANTLVGGLMMLPLGYPLEGWRLHHNRHHATERQGANRGLKAQSSKPFLRLVNPLYWPYDIVTLVLVYYDLSPFNEEEQRDSRLSVLASYGFGVLAFPVLVYYTGVWGLFKFWMAPWFVFHFWKNTLRRALPSVSFAYPNLETTREYLRGSKDGASSMYKRFLLTELSHYSFPSWFEFLCHDVNYQIPHYLAAEIPTYHLRSAHYAILQSRWADRVNQYRFGWGLLRGAAAARQAAEKTAVAAEEVVRETAKAATETAKTTTLADIRGFLASLNWLHVPLFTFTHAMALVGVLTADFSNTRTVVWAVIYYYYTGFGITGGYHRLWAHRAYDAAWPVRFALMLAGSGAVEGSIHWWCRDHRVHHRYTDTDKDPYNARRGFWYSHMGWMLKKQDWRRLGKVNIDDLTADPMIRMQHKYYPAFMLGMGFIFPAVVAGLGWGDWYGGFFIAGMIRLLFVHHATFFVNSLAHTLGDQTYADNHTPRDSFLTAILTLGEGYHNFHHEFPKDYRNAIRFYQYDPTKWIIRFLAFFGLTYNLHTFPENEIQKGAVQMATKKIQAKSAVIDWGDDADNLPLMTMADVAAHKADNWLVIGGIVHDCSSWAADHPGGSKLIEVFAGRDATNAFAGGVYNHSNAGRNMASQLRIGRIVDPDQVDRSLAQPDPFKNLLLDTSAPAKLSADDAARAAAADDGLVTLPTNPAAIAAAAAAAAAAAGKTEVVDTTAADKKKDSHGHHHPPECPEDKYDVMFRVEDDGNPIGSSLRPAPAAATKTKAA